MEDTKLSPHILGDSHCSVPQNQKNVSFCRCDQKHVSFHVSLLTVGRIASSWSPSFLSMTASLLRLSFGQHQGTQTLSITCPGWQHNMFITEPMMICSLTTHPMLCLLQLVNNRQSPSISHIDRMRARPTTDFQ